MRGRGRGAVRGGGGKRVTRSVSMKEKMKESAGDNDGQSSGEFLVCVRYACGSVC
jgi:hypothetical protein